MSEWRIFHGNREPHRGIERLIEIEAPSWRRFSGRSHQTVDAEKDQKYWETLRSLSATRTREIERGRTFRIREEYAEVIDAVNAALYLRRPLLITGRPGSGKTSLAYAIAYELNLGPVLLWSITTRSALTSGLYQYDAIARLQDAQMSETERKIAQSSQASSANSEEKYRDIGRYIRLGAVGTAFLSSQLPRVLLIDEIDKSDINLPNDLLNLFEEGEFPIPELKRLADQGNRLQIVTSEDEQKVEIEAGQVQCEAFPIVIMTSNGERDFPPAFLRRCLQVRMLNPTEEDLVQIVEAHLKEPITQEFRDIIREFADMNDSEEGERATDQLLNLLYILNQNADHDRLKELLFKPLSRMGLN